MDGKLLEKLWVWENVTLDTVIREMNVEAVKAWEELTMPRSRKRKDPAERTSSTEPGSLEAWKNSGIWKEKEKKRKRLKVSDESGMTVSHLFIKIKITTKVS